MKDAKVHKRYLNLWSCFSRSAALLWVLALLACSAAVHAQTPSPATPTSGGKSQEGFTPGWGFGTKFEGSTSSDGTVMDLGTGVGYNFSRHFGVDLGVPYFFVGTPTSIKQKNASAVSGNGLGNAGADLKWNYPGHALNYASTIHLMTFGYNASTEAGIEFDAGPLSLTASAYDIAPWGPQTVISKVFRCSSGGTCVASGTSTDRRGYTTTSVQTGGASLTRDNGFNAGVELKPVRFLDLEVDYSRSVPLRLNNLSFGIGVDIGSLLRSR